MERFGRVRLSAGVTRRAMATFYFAAMFSTCLMAFMNFAQPFVLTEVLRVPLREQGTLSGLLATTTELVIMVAVGAAGVLSDRIGRRSIYVAGFLILAATYGAYPFASAVSHLYLLRVVFAVGAACVSAMLATVVADYPAEGDRGKAAGVMGVMNGLGIMFALLFLAKLPATLARRGFDPRTAGRVAYGFTAVLCVAVAAVLAWGLVRGRPERQREPRSFAALAREAALAAKDPTIALAYGAAFVSRGDLAVVGTFLTLWVSQHGTERGMDGARALGLAGAVMAISQGAAFLWAPVVGVLADRLHRVTALALALGLAAVGYGSMYFVVDPTNKGMLTGACVIGMGEISALISSQVLIGEKAPAHARGSVVGAFGCFGALGILAASSVGGRLFDTWARSGPFVLMGALNAVVMVWAVAVRLRKVALDGPAVVAGASAMQGK